MTQQPTPSFCPSCAQPVLFGAIRCTRCGKEFQASKYPALHPVVLTACILLCIACVWYIGGSLWAVNQANQVEENIRNLQNPQTPQQQQQQQRQQDINNEFGR